MLRRCSLEGNYPAIATHDPAMIDLAQARRHRARHRRPIASNSRCSTASAATSRRHWSQDGYRLRIYVPFGREWFPYFMRRLGERPANLLFVARGVLGER